MIMQAMKPYSNDLRRKIVEAYESGDYSQDEVAELFGVSNATVRNFLRRKREIGSSDALPHAGGRAPALDSKDREQLRKLARDNDDATLAELCRLVDKNLKKSISSSAMCRLLQVLNLPRKKSRSTLRSVTLPGSGRRGAITKR